MIAKSEFKSLIEDVETVQTHASDEASALANTPVGLEDEGVTPESEGAQALTLLQSIADLLRELVDLQNGEEDMNPEKLPVPDEKALPEEPPKENGTAEFTKTRREV